MTSSEARAHLQATQIDLHGQAESCRRMADEYRRAANDADDMDLRSVQFEQSSAYAAQARQLDRDADAIDLVLRSQQHEAGR